MFNHTVLHKLVNRFEKRRSICSQASLSAASTDASGSEVILKLGDSGPLVHSLQISLAHLNLYRGPLNGHFGPALAQALTQVQYHFNLPITGEFDSATWYALSFWTDELERATTTPLPHQNPMPILPGLNRILSHA